MPGANYMGGKRNAAKARVKDAEGRIEKTFFGQRRLCALSKGLASKPKQRYNVPLEESLGFADISLGHARQRQKIPLYNDVFIPNPIHISPCTPRSRRDTRKRLEHSSSSNISKSAVLDALDVSEPMFLRSVLDRILTMPDLAGISGNRIKSAVATGRQSQVSDESDESSPLQWTKRKRSPSDLYEESDSLKDERPSPSLRVSRDESYTGIPTSIVFQGLKDRSAKRSMMAAFYPIEEQTVYGTLFERDDPWDTIGQILGLTNTKPSDTLEEVINELGEIDGSEASLEPRSAVVEGEKPLDRDLMNVDSDEIPRVQYAPVIETRLIELERNRAFSGRDSAEESDEPEIPEYVRAAQLSYLRKNVEEIVQGCGDDQDCLALGDIEGKRLFAPTPLPQNKIEVLKPPDRIKTGEVELNCLESREQGNGESKSVLAIPELQELNGIFMGPTLFNALDWDEDEM